MPTPSTQTQIDFLIDLISQGKSHGQCLAQFGTKWNKSKNTFERRWNIANEQYKEAQKTLKDKVSELTTAKTLEAVNNGLKLKFEHQMELQNEIEGLQKMLRDGFVAKKITINGKVEEKTEVFGVYEITQLQKLIDEKRRELFKLDGMYAPAKTAATNVDGTDAIESPIERLIRTGATLTLGK